MNFQAVSVGQKLIESGVKGGYTTRRHATFSMEAEIKFVDAAIGQWVNELKKQRLLDSTTIIITAKHGHRRSIRIGSFPSRSQRHEWYSTVGATRGSVLAGLGNQPDRCYRGRHFVTVAQPRASTLAAVGLLEANAKAAGSARYSTDPRWRQSTANRVCRRQAEIRVPRTSSLRRRGRHLHGKPEEAGGTRRLCPGRYQRYPSGIEPVAQARTVTSFVETSQVAPTVLKILGLDPSALDAVRKEGTPVLPGLHFGE